MIAGKAGLAHHLCTAPAACCWARICSAAHELQVTRDRCTSSQFLSMLPYLATIVVLVLISRNASWIRINMPASLGKPFYPGS
jgi:ABC-type uncharacterized transport system permease subunit